MHIEVGARITERGLSPNSQSELPAEWEGLRKIIRILGRKDDADNPETDRM